MSTPTPGVKITLDKERTLRYGGGALMMIEEKTGKNLLKGEIGSDLSFTEVVIFIWAGLTHEDESLTVREVADLIDMDRIDEIGEAMNTAIMAAFPDKPKTGARERGKGPARK